MITGLDGLTAKHLADSAGHLLDIPYRIAAHGFFLTAPYADMVLVILPISAIEDPKFMRVLCQKGIYRIEDVNGSSARIGEGRVIDRLRRHRANPVVLPGMVAAAFGLQAEWTFPTRRALEAMLAADWVAEGNSLASRTFNWTILNSHKALLADLSIRHDDLRRLLMLADLVLDNDADEFLPVLRPAEPSLPQSSRPQVSKGEPGTEVRLRQTRHALHTRTFSIGCTIRYDDGLISACATVRRDGIVLHPGSSVYLSVGVQAGRKYLTTHTEFLTRAGVDDDGEIGTTTVAVVADTAAFLLKSITGGRIHMASRWQVTSSKE